VLDGPNATADGLHWIDEYVHAALSFASIYRRRVDRNTLTGLARLRGLEKFLIPRPLPINGLAVKVCTTEGDWVGGLLRSAVAAVAANRA
jgi:hypothetical protein